MTAETSDSVSSAVPKGHAGMVDRQVQVFQREDHAMLLGQVAMRFSVSRAFSHMAPVTISHGVIGIPPSPRPVPCRLSR